MNIIFLLGGFFALELLWWWRRVLIFTRHLFDRWLLFCNAGRISFVVDRRERNFRWRTIHLIQAFWLTFGQRYIRRRNGSLHLHGFSLFHHFLSLLIFILDQVLDLFLWVHFSREISRSTARQWSWVRRRLASSRCEEENRQSERDQMREQNSQEVIDDVSYKNNINAMQSFRVNLSSSVKLGQRVLGP